MNTQAAVSELVILLRTATQGGVEYCAGVTEAGEWLRLTPLSFNRAQSAKHLKRWDKVKFTTKERNGDLCTVMPHSLTIIGEYASVQRAKLLQKLKVTSLAVATAQGQTLALLQPKDAQFLVRRRTEDEAKPAAGDTKKPFSYRYSYKFTSDDGVSEAFYEDEEMNGTLLRLAKSFGEAGAIARLVKTYGKDYLKQGVYFIMSRDSVKDTSWRIAAVVSRDEAMHEQQDEVLNVVC